MNRDGLRHGPEIFISRAVLFREDNDVALFLCVPLAARKQGCKSNAGDNACSNGLNVIEVG